MFRTISCPEEITTDYVAAALGVPPDALADVDVEPLGTGQIAATVLVHLTWNQQVAGRPATVVVKFAGTADDNRDAERRLATFHREVGFYCSSGLFTAGSTDALPIPHVFASAEPGDGSFTIVMETARGSQGDQLVGCSPRVAGAIVDVAARLHSVTWSTEHEFGRHPWVITGAGKDAEIVRRNARYAALLPGFIDRYRNRLSDDVLSVAQSLSGCLEQMEKSLRLPVCLCHNDFRLDNMIIDEDSDPVGVTVVDWQTVGTGSGAVDVSYALGSGLSRDERRVHEGQLLDRYVEVLRSGGVVVDRDAVEHDYRVGAASGLVMAVIASQVVRRTERGDEMFAVMAERHGEQMIDVGTLSAIAATGDRPTRRR